MWNLIAPQFWEAEVQRFFEGFRNLDNFLAEDVPLGYPAEKVFQGPIADALTHVGQFATLQRLAGSPVREENYFQAEIMIGPEQPAIWAEFDSALLVGCVSHANLSMHKMIGA